MDFIKDFECSRDTPVTRGKEAAPVYGAGYAIHPCVPGRHSTAYEQSVYLPHLLPLEEYDLIIILLSGGKDSIAAYFRLLELGVPKEKMELWHHDIDGGNPERWIDWPVTAAYVRSFAQAAGVPLRVSWRINGFWGEVYRLGASFPIQYEDGGDIKTCPLTRQQVESARLRQLLLEQLDENHLEELKGYGYRMKFPAKASDLSRRWCSACLKIDIASAVIRNLESLESLRQFGQRGKFPAKSGCHQGRWCNGNLKASVESSVVASLDLTRQNTNILVVSGERRGESAGRAGYNEMEVHRTNATKKAHRLVHHWRAVIDHSVRDVWEILRRHNITPHPCYTCGWNRCSCAMCIFGLPKHWAGIRELFPAGFEAVCQDEVRLGFTLDNKKSLRDYVGDVQSCVCRDNPQALRQLITGEFGMGDIYCKDEWVFPAGAFGGAEGGPC